MGSHTPACSESFAQSLRIKEVRTDDIDARLLMLEYNQPSSFSFKKEKNICRERGSNATAGNRSLAEPEKSQATALGPTPSPRSRGGSSEPHTGQAAKAMKLRELYTKLEGFLVYR